jgi:hypothetical protein
MPMLMKIVQRKQHMEQKAALEQRMHAWNETALEGRRQAAAVPGKFDRAVAVDLDATPLRPGKNKLVADVLAATIAENAVEMGTIVGEMAAVAVVVVVAAADLHTERIDSFLKRQAIQEGH